VKWLRGARPGVVNADEMQRLFGGRRSFDWAVAEEDGAVGPYPAFPAFGTNGASRGES
jgi:hypothetical protein